MNQYSMHDPYSLHLQNIAHLGYHNVILFVLATVMYVVLRGRSFNEQEENEKCTSILILEVLVNTWLMLVMAYASYTVLTMVEWKGIQPTEAFLNAIGGAWFTFYLSYDSKLKGQLGILQKRVQCISAQFWGGDAMYHKHAHKHR